MHTLTPKDVAAVKCITVLLKEKISSSNELMGNNSLFGGQL